MQKPTELTSLQSVVDFSVSYNESAFVDAGGKIYSWDATSQKPELIDSLLDLEATRVCCGLGFVIGLGQTVELNKNKTIDEPLRAYHQSLHTLKSGGDRDLPLKQIICDLSEQNRKLQKQNSALASKLKQVSEERD